MLCFRTSICTDRMEIENSGGLYGRMTLDNLELISADSGK
jgi:hypothetical protein